MLEIIIYTKKKKKKKKKLPCYSDILKKVSIAKHAINKREIFILFKNIF